MIERAPEVVAAPEPITMVGVQAMIWAMMVKQREEMRKLLLNRDQPTVPIVLPELNEELSEDGNYSHIVSQVGPRVVRRNEPDRRIERYGCMYKNFLGAKQPSLYRSPETVEIMVRISEMEMIFETCNSSDKQKTVFAVRQLKTTVLSWCKLLSNTMP